MSGASFKSPACVIYTVALLRDIPDFLVQLVLRGVIIATPIHEYSHMLAMRMVGIRGYVGSFDFNHVQWIDTPSAQQASLVYFMGGFGTAILLLFLSLFEEDDDKLTVNLGVAGTQFVYALLEQHIAYTGDALAMVLPAIPLSLAVLWWMRNHTKSK